MKQPAAPIETFARIKLPAIIDSFMLVAGLLAGWLPGWLAGWLAGWLVGWLGGWVAGWLAASCYLPPRGLGQSPAMNQPNTAIN